MKKRIVLILITLLCAAMANVQSARAATMTVTNTNDSGAGSLRQALADANDGDTINFSVTTPATITLTSGTLGVNKSVTINGPGADQLSVNGNAAYTVFVISSGKTLTASGLTITNGMASVYGGGIYGNVSITNCTISGNTAGGWGGGIFGDGISTITNCTISGNSANNSGGGIFGAMTVNNSTISNNSAGIYGGGIYGDGTITNSTISGNSAGTWGGGIAFDGILTVANSIISGNSANGYGGGGIFNADAMLTITNSTISGNSALNGYGGGIANEGYNCSICATATITNCTFSDNSAAYGGGIDDGTLAGVSGGVTIANSILKASSIHSGNFYFPFISLGYNMSDDDGGGVLTGPGDQVYIDPLLGPLQDNGGPTFTHALLGGSPAIDAGDPSFTPPPDYDQRGPGFDRVVNGRIDIGAFEVQPVSTPACAAQVQPPINADGSSIFNVRRGVVPVKFSLTCDGNPTCGLPPATIAVTRTAGGVIGEVNESVYSSQADSGSDFRVLDCQYHYNLNSSALGVGIYRVDILINGHVVGSATFQLK